MPIPRHLTDGSSEHACWVSDRIKCRVPITAIEQYMLAVRYVIATPKLTRDTVGLYDTSYVGVPCTLTLIVKAVFSIRGAFDTHGVHKFAGGVFEKDDLAADRRVLHMDVDHR